MNLQQLKNNVGFRVRLEPPACRLDEYGRKLPTIADDWIIEDVSDQRIRISNTRTGHILDLAKDHIHHFTSDPGRAIAGVQHGFLTLLVQVFLRGRDVRLRPTLRPGEPIEPEPNTIKDKLVDFRYPALSGIQQRLEAAGYETKWCLETKLSAKLDLEGWEVVIERERDGGFASYRVKDRPADQILIKRKIR